MRSSFAAFIPTDCGAATGNPCAAVATAKTTTETQRHRDRYKTSLKQNPIFPKTFRLDRVLKLIPSFSLCLRGSNPLCFQFSFSFRETLFAQPCKFFRDRREMSAAKAGEAELPFYFRAL